MFPPEEASSTSSGSDFANLDDALRAATGEAAPADEVAAAAQPQFYPREEWCVAYLRGHGVAGNMLGIAPLAAIDENAKGGMDAAGAIYDICVETPMLHFIVSPASKWLERAMAIGFFYAPLCKIVSMEMRARRAKDVTPKPARETAPGAQGLAENAMPAGSGPT